jgi:hypothetical protein
MNNIHVLPTDKPSSLFIDDNKLKICVPLGGEHMMNQHIYITSSEEIKEGDWFVQVNTKKIIKHHPKNGLLLQPQSFDKKIILTTDQILINAGVQPIDDEFLEWFVKNPSCEDVEVEKQMLCDYCGQEHCDNLRCRGYKDSVWYEIIIPQEEPKHIPYTGKVWEPPKQETVEEAADNYSENWEEITGLDYDEQIPSFVNKLDFIEGAKWQAEQDNNKFSEKVETLWVRYRKTTNNEDAWSFKEWLVEQFKNK